MITWLVTIVLAVVITALWGCTPCWLGLDWLHWGWELAVYAVLVAVPLAVIGVFATRQQLKTARERRGWRIANVNLGLLLVWTLTLIFAGFHDHWDFVGCLYPWTSTYAEHGFLWSMRHFTDVSNYTAFYNYFLIILGQCQPTWFAALYAIKYYSFLASIAMGIAVALIVAHVRQKPLNWWVVIGCLLLPPVLTESAIWGQCDAIYVAFCLFAFYAALKHRSKTSMVLVGLAFAIKFQFIFIVPTLFLMLIVKDADGKHYLRWRDLWLAPLMYVVNLLPALFGAEFLPLITTYFGQSSGNYLTANCASLPALTSIIMGLWQGLPLDQVAADVLFPWYEPLAEYWLPYVGHFVLGVVACGLLVWAIIRRCRHVQPTAADWVHYALLFALMMPLAMPHMHERFMFLAMVLAVGYALAVPHRRSYWVAALIVVSLCLTVVFNALGIIPRPWRILSLTVATLLNVAAWIMLLLPLNRRQAVGVTPLPVLQ